MISTEMPRKYMARCAQCGRKGIFEYHEKLIVGWEHLHYIGYLFRDEAAARSWDDSERPDWWSFPSWENAEAWLYDHGAHPW